MTQRALLTNPRSERARASAPSPPQVPDWLRGLVTLSDDAFRVPGTELRFGLDGVVGLLLPGLGDALSGTLTLSLLFAAHRQGAPLSLMLRMLLNIAIDSLVGAVPLLGDAFDLGFKAGRRNLVLLEQHAHRAPGARSKASVFAVTLVVLAALALTSLPAVAVYLAWRMLS